VSEIFPGRKKPLSAGFFCLTANLAICRSRLVADPQVFHRMLTKFSQHIAPKCKTTGLSGGTNVASND